jgi:hypothetical protein
MIRTMWARRLILLPKTPRTQLLLSRNVHSPPERRGKKIFLAVIGGGLVGSAIYYQTLEEQQKRSCRVAVSAIGRFFR